MVNKGVLSHCSKGKRIADKVIENPLHHRQNGLLCIHNNDVIEAQHPEVGYKFWLEFSTGHKFSVHYRRWQNVLLRR